ncbi:hypothetical protein ACFLVI_04490 [Chloroflexota bacterium]
MIKHQINQKGATLLEILAAMAVMVLIVNAAAMLIHVEINGTATAKTKVTTSYEIGNATRYITEDVTMAEVTNLVDGAQPIDFLDITWTDRYDLLNLAHSSGYFLVGTELCRNYDGNVTVVARDISGIEFSRTGRIITVSISCTPGWWGESETTQNTFRAYWGSVSIG